MHLFTKRWKPDWQHGNHHDNIRVTQKINKEPSNYGNTCVTKTTPLTGRSHHRLQIASAPWCQDHNTSEAFGTLRRFSLLGTPPLTAIPMGLAQGMELACWVLELGFPNGFSARCSPQAPCHSCGFSAEPWDAGTCVCTHLLLIPFQPVHWQETGGWERTDVLCTACLNHAAGKYRPLSSYPAPPSHLIELLTFQKQLLQNKSYSFGL